MQLHLVSQLTYYNAVDAWSHQSDDIHDDIADADEYTWRILVWVFLSLPSHLTERTPSMQDMTKLRRKSAMFWLSGLSGHTPSMSVMRMLAGGAVLGYVFTQPIHIPLPPFRTSGIMLSWGLTSGRISNCSVASSSGLFGVLDSHIPRSLRLFGRWHRRSNGHVELFIVQMPSVLWDG